MLIWKNQKNRVVSLTEQLDSQSCTKVCVQALFRGNVSMSLEHACQWSSHPVLRCGQSVVEAAQRHHSVELGDGDQLLTAALLKVDHFLNVLLKHEL